MNSLLWADVASLLAKDFRVIAPDLPLGSHTQPLEPGADLTPTGLAKLIADFLVALGLDFAQRLPIALTAGFVRQPTGAAA